MKIKQNVKQQAKNCVVFILFFGVSQAVFAEKQVNKCKGLAVKLCDAKEQCSWVKPYQRKDGKRISGFCRTKASVSNKKATTAKKTKAAKKTTKKASDTKAKKASTKKTQKNTKKSNKP